MKQVNASTMAQLQRFLLDLAAKVQDEEPSTISESIHPFILEQIDKEMRSIPVSEISPILISDDLEKLVYPLTNKLIKVITKYRLPNKFYFEKPGKHVMYFSVNQNEGTISVIVVSLVMKKG